MLVILKGYSVLGRFKIVLVCYRQIHNLLLCKLVPKYCQCAWQIESFVVVLVGFKVFQCAWKIQSLLLCQLDSKFFSVLGRFIIVLVCLADSKFVGVLGRFKIKISVLLQVLQIKNFQHTKRENVNIFLCREFLSFLVYWELSLFGYVVKSYRSLKVFFVGKIDKNFL